MTGIVAEGALWLAVLIAMLAGLVSFLSPCCLPLVPGYLGYIGGAVGAGPDPGQRRGRVIGGVLLFVAGFTVVFMAMNIFGGALGRFFLAYRDPITRVLGVVVILLGLVFIGVFRFAQRTVKPAVRGNLGLAGAPLLGLAFGVGWAPCLSPTLGVIVALSWNVGDPVRAGILGLAYSVGLGIPFLLIALGAGWATRSIAFLRRHVRVVNLIGGGLLIIIGVLMVTGVWGALMSQLQGLVGTVLLPL